LIPLFIIFFRDQKKKKIKLNLIHTINVFSDSLDSASLFIMICFDIFKKKINKVKNLTMNILQIILTTLHMPR